MFRKQSQESTKVYMEFWLKVEVSVGKFGFKHLKPASHGILFIYIILDKVELMAAPRYRWRGKGWLIKVKESPNWLKTTMIHFLRLKRCSFEQYQDSVSRKEAEDGCAVGFSQHLPRMPCHGLFPSHFSCTFLSHPHNLPGSQVGFVY